MKNISRPYWLLLLAPLVFLAFWVFAQPSRGPYPQKGIPGLYITNNGAGYTNADGTITINAPGGSGSGLPGTNTVADYGDARNTNSMGSFLGIDLVASNANGSVQAIGGILSASAGVKVTGGSPGILVSNTLGSGGDYTIIGTNGGTIFGTNAEQGVWWALGTNSTFFTSNALKGAYYLCNPTNFIYSNSIAYMSITNGHIFVTNYTASGESVDIDPSVAGSIFYGDNNRTNYEQITVSGVVISNAVGFQLLSSDSQVQSNRLTGNVTVQTNGTISVTGGIQSTGGSIFLSLNTNNAGHAQQTNALTWSTIQATNEWTFWAFATNLTISGYQNVENAHMYHGWLCASNGAAANVTISPPAGVRIMATLTTNQPNNTITVTNGKTVLIEWFLNSHLAQNITQWVVYNQQN